MPRAAETPAGTYVAKRIADYIKGKSNASRLDNIEVSCAGGRPHRMHHKPVWRWRSVRRWSRPTRRRLLDRQVMSLNSIR